MSRHTRGSNSLWSVVVGVAAGRRGADGLGEAARLFKNILQHPVHAAWTLAVESQRVRKLVGSTTAALMAVLVLTPLAESQSEWLRMQATLPPDVRWDEHPARSGPQPAADGGRIPRRWTMDSAELEGSVRVDADPETPVVTRISQFEDNVVVMRVSGSLTTAEFDFRALARSFHEHYPDEFDYLVFVSNLPTREHNQHYTYYGAHRTVQNAVSGIGRRVFGSGGTLKSSVHLPYRTAILHGPMLHELMHSWANYVVPTSTRAHWGFSSANGQLGGFDLDNLVHHGGGRYSAGWFGDFANGGNSVPYSPIELYLAGFIPPWEVPDLWVAKDGQWTDERDASDNLIFSASDIETWSVERIVEEHGVRVPNWNSSQRSFRAAVVLLADEQFPAMPTILHELADAIRIFSHPGPDSRRSFNFWEATGGRATLKMDDLRSGTVGANRAPVPVGSLASVRLAAGGAAAEVDVAAAFRDPDGDALTYQATSSAPSVVAVSVFGTTVSVTPVAGGTSTVTVTARDPGGLSATQVFTVRVTTVATAAQDRATLEIFYHAAGGANWFRNDNWVSDADLREWYGVDTDESGRVITLYLSYNTLTGPIPSSLGGLTNLEELSLDSNNLTGPIPAELGNLANLTTLRLSFNNNLTGPIPAELGNLVSLEELSLDGNNVTGPIPAELGDLVSLWNLNLARNEFTGPIPAELGNLANLGDLSLAGNNVTGPIPAELGDLVNLWALHLDRNELAGPIPNELGSLARLTYLNLRYNELTGPIPPELGNLSRLTQLVLGDNPLTGTVPESLTQLSLRTFWIDATGVCMPAGAGFQAWVATIENFRGDTCSGEVSSWTDHQIMPGVTPVRAVHVMELRRQVDAARLRCGLGSVTWIDPVIRPGVTPIKAVHVTQLRATIDATYQACGQIRPTQTRPAWTDPQIIPRVTRVTAVHFNELRDAVQELDGTPGTTQAPELVVEAPLIGGSPQRPGDTFTLSVTVRNVGTGPSEEVPPTQRAGATHHDRSGPDR